MTPPPLETSVRCVQCGQNLTGATIGGTCPECGAPVAPSFESSGAAVSGKAITSLVLGIVSIVATPGGCMCLGLTSVVGVVLGIVAIVFSRLAAADIRTGQAHPASAGMATAGLVCGIIGLSLGMLVILAVVGVLIADSLSGM